MKKRFIFFASIIFLGMPLHGVITLEENPAEKIDPIENKEEKKDDLPPTKKQRVVSFSKALGYASLNVATAIFIFNIFNVMYKEYSRDDVRDIKEIWARLRLDEQDEEYQEFLREVASLNAIRKPAIMVLGIMLTAATVYTNYKRKMIPNAWKFFKQALK